MQRNISPVYQSAHDAGASEMPPRSVRSMGKFLFATALLLAACDALRVSPTPRLAQKPISPAVQPAVNDEARAAAVWAGAAALLAVVEPAAAGDGAWAGTVKFALTPVLTLGTLAFLMRTVLSWFPKYDLKAMPWVIIAVPTEPFLKATRALIPPVAGVDITPIVWVSILSFFSEIFTGPQGLLTIIEKKGGL